MKKEFIALFEHLEREKGIKRDVIIKAINEGLHAAARKNVKGYGENISVELDPKTGELEVFAQKRIVDKVTNPKEEISIEEALLIHESSEVGKTIEIPIMPEDFGRIAAQATRQVLHQKIRGAEKDVIYSEYKHRVGQLISGTVKQFIKGKTLIVDIGKITAILPERNLPKIHGITEEYKIGEKVQALLLEVKENPETGSAEVILTRSHKEFVAALFTQEVPELHDKTIVIEKIERDPGYRTKIAVSSFDQKVDPVGTCVGVRGSRINQIIAELNGEKIDVVPYLHDQRQFLEKLLGKSVLQIGKASSDLYPIICEYSAEGNKIWIAVNDEDFASVVGKKGANVRLIARMIERELEVQKISEYRKILTLQMAELADSEDQILDEKLKIDGVAGFILDAYINAGFDTLRKFMTAAPADIIAQVPNGKYYEHAKTICNQLRKK
jgi:N utilization substance protein A